jgi:biotin synthase
MVDNTDSLKLLNYILTAPLKTIFNEGDSIRRQYYGNKLEICGIVNAKSGKCGEDCKFCAQSSHYNTDIIEYPLLETEEIIKKAKRAKKYGAQRIGIVTSGNILGNSDIERLFKVIRVLVDDVGIGVCGSLGALSKKDLRRLGESGMTRYHHNIESSGRFYPMIVSTHNYKQRLETISKAKEAGLEVCSGGIIGMGEKWEDRLDMALTLRELDVDAVPLNFLVPIKGTALGNRKLLSREEAIRTIFLFRRVLKNKSIKVIAGRENVLGRSQKLIYQAGANGMLIDGYLTVPGRSLQDDIDLISEIKGSWNII